LSVAVIGSGFAGLAAADALVRAGVATEVYEARDEWGGHTRSDSVEGFTFDEGPHLSFTTDDQVKAVFAAGAGEVREIDARITNYFHGRWIKHPAQCHLHGLDPGLVTACIVDMVAAHREPPELHNYADWCVAKFGRTFAETFPFAYTRKYWTVDAETMSLDWIGKRIYPPSLEEVVRGALGEPPRGDFHYLSRVRYPETGGYQAFMRGIAHPELIRTSSAVESIDPVRRRLRLAGGAEPSYDQLVSTMPLPELVSRVVPSAVPAAVRDAAGRLACSSLVLVDVAVARADLLGAEWFYVYDEDISFARAHFPHLLSARNAPEGCGSIQAEVYYSRDRPLPCAAEDLPARVVEELVEMKVLRSAGEVMFTRHRVVPFANIIFDHHRAAALAIINAWADEAGILLAGRYGEWGYHWTDDATRSGWAAAAKVLERVGDAAS